jgi:3-deoxy-manno-octulosonate cytidylyltransferase (CMP-KDO synthetase)
MLATVGGRPLVQHVVERANAARRSRRVIVATDDQRIVDALRPFNTHCLLTSPAHPSGTDRVAEVAAGLDDDIIVNVQGDEPEIDPDVIDRLIERMELHDDDMATCCTPMRSMDDVNNPNMVKLVVGMTGHALYFSRAAIPFNRDVSPAIAAGRYALHLGIYAYRREFLIEFAALPPTPLEQTEKLEQLRALEHGRRIYVVPVEHAASGIDTPEQFEAFLLRSR